jgi:leucyl-tRNA synthetase
VEQLKLKQWFFRITAFKEALLEDLDVLAAQGRWPERVIVQQRNWLGKSTGAKFKFLIQSGVTPVRDSRALINTSREIEVFTTRPDTLFGVTYLALSMNHPLVQQAALHSTELRSFLELSKSFPSDSKAGFRLSNVTAINPLVALPNMHEFPGDGAFALPVYAAPYVLDEYGTGAVMGVPGHDSRDLAFWRAQNPEYPVPLVVSPASKREPINLVLPANTLDEAYTGPGKLTRLSGAYAGLENDQAGKQITADLKTYGDSADFVDTWRLRDWLVSRQRYWGTPIPIIHCESCGAVPVPEGQLPVELPPLEKPKEGQLGNPLQNIEWWVNTACPSCGGPARRDTDTMDTFVDSSWYFMRFPDAGNEDELVSKDIAKRMLPVDVYLGGVEHAILHLLYARFIFKFLASEGLVPQADGEPVVPAEPFRQLISQGMVHGKTFSDPLTGRFLRPDEVEGSDTTEPLIKASKATPTITWEKMSKSKYNGVDPLNCMTEYGTDAVRAHILFAAPVMEVLDWDEEKIVGIQRWFHRIRRLIDMARSTSASSKLDDVEMARLRSILRENKDKTFFGALSDDEADVFLLIHQTILSLTNTFEHNLYGLNTGVSDLIKLTNGLLAVLPKWQNNIQEDRLSATTPKESTAGALVIYHGITVLLRMLAPIAPAFAEQCWEDLHADKVTAAEAVASIFDCAWPEAVLDTSLAASLAQRRKTMTCAVQVNGKLRFTLDVPIPSADGNSETKQRKARDEFLAGRLLESDQGRYWLTEKNNWEKRKKVIVVQEGKLVNVVF